MLRVFEGLEYLSSRGNIAIKNSGCRVFSKFGKENYPGPERDLESHRRQILTPLTLTVPSTSSGGPPK